MEPERLYKLIVYSEEDTTPFNDTIIIPLVERTMLKELLFEPTVTAFIALTISVSYAPRSGAEPL